MYQEQERAMEMQVINYRKWMCLLLAAVMLFLHPIYLLPTSAKENDPLEEMIYEITECLEEVFEMQYQSLEREIKELILARGYDYTITMESFYQKGNPFSQVDYMELIATYGAVKDYCNHHGISVREGLAGIQFLNMQVEHKEIRQNIAVLIPAYKLLEDGIYIREGNRRIEKETIVDTYETTDGEHYVVVGKETVSPKEDILTYGEVTITYKGMDAVYEYYGLEKSMTDEACGKILEKLEQKTTKATLTQSVFVQTPKAIEILGEEMLTKIEELTKNLTGTEAVLVNTALSLVGQVPYQWGGKPAKPGYDTSWWLYDESGNQKGLDCSGFVHWVYWTAGFDEKTVELAKNSWNLMEIEDTPREELRPGDIGILNHNETTNHLGIYLGDDLFIHCSSGKQTVTVSEFPFTYFKSVQNLGEINSQTLDNYANGEYSEINYTLSIDAEKKYSKDVIVETPKDRDILLLSQLMIHEAGNQGYNGKVAVAEVVMNRVRNSKWKENTIPEVIYAPGQFSYVENIPAIEPDEETLALAKMVLNGQISILNNPNVLYFRNPMITSNIKADDPVDWGTLKWYTAINQHAFYTE